MHPNWTASPGRAASLAEARGPGSGPGASDTGVYHDWNRSTSFAQNGIQPAAGGEALLAVAQVVDVHAERPRKRKHDGQVASVPQTQTRLGRRVGGAHWDVEWERQMSGD